MYQTLGGVILGLHEFATGNQQTSYGITICSPLSDKDDKFTGSYCADLLPTFTNDQDNYLEDMYFGSG